MIENRMTKTKATPSSVARHRANMNRINGNARPYTISVWDAREKRTTHTMKFITQYEADDYLKRMTIKRNNRHYHKGAFGRLDMELEYTLKK